MSRMKKDGTIEGRYRRRKMERETGREEGERESRVFQRFPEGFREGRGRLGMTLRGLARFAGVRSRELRCRARRRQTSVRATRLRFYATLCLYPCLLTALSFSLYSSSSSWATTIPPLVPGCAVL